MKIRHRLILLGLPSILVAYGCVFDDTEECLANGTCSDGTATSTTTATTGSGGGQTGGGGGTGGAEPCGGTCKSPTPLCDTKTNTCVACLGHSDCTEADAARCDAGSCVACQDSAECAGVAEGAVCHSSSCVECALSDESACTSGKTCDLLAFKCVDVAPGSILNCNGCTNDKQCDTGHRCIPMDFEMKPHGHYCLAEPSPTCNQPFLVAINEQSINGEAATDYCGIKQDLTTCEAVLALVNNWACTNADGMCGPMNKPEQAVPGAICRKVGLGGNRCTYACGIAAQCLSDEPADTCGTGSKQPPGWCGG